jgi:hypothetical protein
VYRVLEFGTLTASLRAFILFSLRSYKLQVLANGPTRVSVTSMLSRAGEGTLAASDWPASPNDSLNGATSSDPGTLATPIQRRAVRSRTLAWPAWACIKAEPALSPGGYICSALRILYIRLHSMNSAEYSNDSLHRHLPTDGLNFVLALSPPVISMYKLVRRTSLALWWGRPQHTSLRAPRASFYAE